LTVALLARTLTPAAANPPATAPERD